MISFHGSEQVRDFYLARVDAHKAADEIVQGIYWEKGKGCAVGCTLHSRYHSEYENLLGIPKILAHLQDAVFEALLPEDAKYFPGEFLRAAGCGKDLSQVVDKWIVWCLRMTTIWSLTENEGSSSCLLVEKLYIRKLARDEPHPYEWDQAYKKSCEESFNSTQACVAAAAVAWRNSEDFFIPQKNLMWEAIHCKFISPIEARDALLRLMRES